MRFAAITAVFVLVASSVTYAIPLGHCDGCDLAADSALHAPIALSATGGSVALPRSGSIEVPAGPVVIDRP